MELPQCWQDVSDVVAAGVRRIILFGPSGTGKTYAALRYGVTTATAERLVCTEDLTVGEITGTWLPHRDGEWHWKEGPAIRSWRGEGGRLVIDEVDRASGDALSTLLAITDSPESARWRHPESGEWLRPGAQFSVVMTTNAEQLRDIPSALRDRFPVAIRIDQPHPGALEILSPDLRGPAQSCAVAEPSRRISLRSFYAFDQLRAHLGAHRAATLLFGEQSESFLDAMTISSVT